MPHIAFYAGSFDPPTNGHLDVMRATFAIADELVVAIGTHPGKTPLFSVEERKSMLSAIIAPISKGKPVRIVTFADLTVEAAKREGASMLIRGLRDGTDLDYEMQLAGMNGTMMPQIQTVFLPATPLVRPITATLVRQIAGMGGEVSAFVPDVVRLALAEKFNKKA